VVNCVFNYFLIYKLYTMAKISIHEWQEGSQKGATIKFYKGGFCYASYVVSRERAHAFYMRALKKGIVIPF
jgi:hypothetical protein